MELALGTSVDRYVVERALGRGGMAIVYRVRHTQLDTLHALKILSVGNPAIRERLLQEGRVQARLNHPNVVAVRDVLDIGGSPALLMDYIRGPSLDRLLECRRLELDQVDVLVPRILAGVAAAHDIGVAHRDLKPANILLKVHQHRVNAMVADFGLVKHFGDGDHGQTRTGATMGTPRYMSPEQIRSSKDVDSRTDIFALGAIFYELVTGQRTFDSHDTLELFNLIGDGEYTPPREHVADLPERMATAIAKALQVDRNDRFDTCEAFWECWAGEAGRPLAEAAVVAGSWDAGILEDIETLSHAEEEADPFPSSDTGNWLNEGASVSTFATEGQEDAQTFAPETMDRAPPPPEAPRRVFPYVLAGAVGLSLFAGGTWFASGIGDTSAVAEPEPAPVAGPAPVVEAEPSPDAEPKPEALAEPEAAEPEAPAPTRASPRRAKAEPQPAPPAGGTVVVSGDAEKVWLVPLAGGAKRAPGEVPPGGYAVEAIFAGESTRTGEITVEAGQQVRLICASQILNCAPE